jgi:hypothetical protein
VLLVLALLAGALLLRTGKPGPEPRAAGTTPAGEPDGRASRGSGAESGSPDDSAAAAGQHALLVGINTYDHPKLSALKFAENDAAELAAVLGKAGYAVTLLSGAAKEERLRPSKANIEGRLTEVLGKCGRGDTVLLAFAGHGLQFEGTRDAFFCPIDARPFADQADSLVSLSKVYAELDRSFAGVKLLLVDACRNDPGAGRSIDVDAAPRPPRGIAALFSCSSGERAFETARLGGGHGVFFHFVLEGLRGRAKNARGAVTWARLAEYVTEQVSDQVPRVIRDGAKQTPHLMADLRGKSPILLGPGASSARAERPRVPSKESAKPPAPPRTIRTDHVPRLLTFSADGRTLASRGPTMKGDAYLINLWDAASGKNLFRRDGQNDLDYYIKVLAISADGRTVAQCNVDENSGVRESSRAASITIWDVPSGTRTAGISGAGLVCLALSPDGKTLATAGFGIGRTIKLWDAKTCTNSANVGPDVPLSMAFSPDGKKLAVAPFSSTLKLWDLPSSEATELTGHRYLSRFVTFSADGKTLASVSDDKTIKLWDVATGRCLHTLKEQPPLLSLERYSTDGIALSPDGRTVARPSADGKTVRLWDVRSGKNSATFSTPDGTLFIPAFSPDGKVLAAGRSDGTILLWDLGEGKKGG